MQLPSHRYTHTAAVIYQGQCNVPVLKGMKDGRPAYTMRLTWYDQGNANPALAPIITTADICAMQPGIRPSQSHPKDTLSLWAFNGYSCPSVRTCVGLTPRLSPRRDAMGYIRAAAALLETISAQP